MDLQRLEELYNNTTPGNWGCVEAPDMPKNDEAFIIYIHNAFPTILKRLRAADIFAEAIKGVMEEGGHLLHTEQALADYEKAIK